MQSRTLRVHARVRRILFTIARCNDAPVGTVILVRTGCGKQRTVGTVRTRGPCDGARAKVQNAGTRIRTRDQRFTKPLLYQLSYAGVRAIVAPR